MKRNLNHTTKTKKVTMVVEICVTVPDDTDSSLLHLNNGLEDFRIEEAGMSVEDAEVTGYTTVNVIDDNKEA
jgi:hypothetical protein